MSVAATEGLRGNDGSSSSSCRGVDRHRRGHNEREVTGHSTASPTNRSIWSAAKRSLSASVIRLRDEGNSSVKSSSVRLRFFPAGVFGGLVG